MAGIDGYLAVCGPAFLSHDLAMEQLADQQTLNKLVVESDVLPCSEADAEFTYVQRSSRGSAQVHHDQQRKHCNSAEASVVEEVSAVPVPVTRGKRGLCYDVDQLSDTKRRNRLLKNRESAAQSRKRKLEGAKHYETLLEELTAENKRLRDANGALADRVAEMEALGQSTAVMHNVSPDSRLLTHELC
jgi:hypothetical protein